MSKIPFFLILHILNANSFPGNKLILFCKTWIFPIIFGTFPLWEKYKILKNHCRNVHENCLHVPLIFSRFGHPLSPISEMPYKFIKIVWIFLCDSSMHRAQALKQLFALEILEKNIFLSKSEKNHFFQFWWDWSHIPYDNWKTYFLLNVSSSFGCKTSVIYIFQIV